MQPKYPKIKVKLTGKNANAFSLLGTVKTALRKAAIDEAEIAAFQAEALSGDYDHFLQTAMKWVDVS